ncbi:hypothetical protein C0Q70_15576 [Pomacea canaliculata]|uniref:Uncharacterized protein n=1 Tax=Pomacea canaliculata TaxID=400727 RepID=A0A2T7NV74_POMCA|nr:hypothetical protein C0Q70_15576 [Pomacea canaliculata]
MPRLLSWYVGGCCGVVEGIMVSWRRQKLGLLVHIADDGGVVVVVVDGGCLDCQRGLRHGLGCSPRLSIPLAIDLSWSQPANYPVPIEIGWWVARGGR